MRTLEAAFIFFVAGSMLLQASPPPYGENAFAQQYVLANDIYLTLHQKFGANIASIEEKEGVEAFLTEASEELDLCIYFYNEEYEVRTCSIDRGAFLERDVAGKRVVVGVGK